ncbi:hypothetical protein D7X87_11335 [bacterium D16-54]|nr:hypothetical protein D7X87_11335 [bacterium D16-54]RKJ14351.1 hypothetical protein D7X65_11930 [bacterium D16-56]
MEWKAVWRQAEQGEFLQKNNPDRKRRLHALRRLLLMVLAAVLIQASIPFPGQLTALAAELDVYAEKIPHGRTGRNLTISFKLQRNSGTYTEELYAGFDVSGGEIWDEDEEDRQYGYAFPFEVTKSLPTTENPKSIGKMSGDQKTASLTGRVRRDLTEGYYRVPVVIMEKDGNQVGRADLRVWITKSTGTDSDDDDEKKTYDFVLGEEQSTPDGTYPHVMNFAINLRNNSPATVYNVKASIVADADTDKFPFEINDVNYDRMFEKIAVDETVELGYSFAIREDAYSGYYPISMKIYYSNSSTGEELQTFETSFFVRIHNKDKEDERGEFNEHDRTRARIIIDGFSTNPDTIIAGEEFELILKIKNASSNITATNLLFSMESEKVSDSAVFTTEAGSSSVALNSLAPGGVTELRYRLLSRPGVDQRSYGVTIKAKFDSPEYKNAEEELKLDIPVNQIARLSTGTFEIMPESIPAGSEANVMFGINNTGKVMLYNVTVSFEAASIQATDTYVGNIKPGETGNVDCMVTGAAPTEDEGKVKVLISYEDEAGAVYTEEKEMTLYVLEDMSSMENIDAGMFEEMPEEQEKGGLAAFLEMNQQRLLPGALAVILILVIVIVIMAVKHRRAKTEMESDEDEEE